MIRKTVKFEDLYGRHVEEELYFNLTETELMEIEAGRKGGWSSYLEDVTRSENGAEAFRALGEMVLLAYGERRDDGKGFDKSDEIRARFKNSLAYNELILSFVKDPNSAAQFVEALVPAKMLNRIQQLADGHEERNEAPAPTRPQPQDHLPPKRVAVSPEDEEAFQAWKRQQEGLID